MLASALAALSAVLGAFDVREQFCTGGGPPELAAILQQCPGARPLNMGLALNSKGLDLVMAAHKTVEVYVTGKGIHIRPVHL